MSGWSKSHKHTHTPSKWTGRAYVPEHFSTLIFIVRINRVDFCFACFNAPSECRFDNPTFSTSFSADTILLMVYVWTRIFIQQYNNNSKTLLNDDLLFYWNNPNLFMFCNEMMSNEFNPLLFSSELHRLLNNWNFCVCFFFVFINKTLFVFIVAAIRFIRLNFVQFIWNCKTIVLFVFQTKSEKKRNGARLLIRSIYFSINSKSKFVKYQNHCQNIQPLNRK